MPAAKSKSSLPETQETPRALLIDEFGELDRQLALIEPRHKALKEQINGWFENSPAADPATIDGNQYRLSLTPKRLSRRIKSMAKLFRLLGVRRFLQFASFPLGEAEKLLPTLGAKPDEYIEGDRTGARSITATPLVPPEKAA